MKVLKEILWLVLLAVLIVVPIRVFVAQPFVVEGLSMFPTFDNGDYLVIDELSYRFSPPQRGDVIVFRHSQGVFYIKRVIGLPGETISIERGQVTVTKSDGSTLTLDESYVINEDATYTLDATLGPKQYFVMGDNRPKSSDSRSWGALEEKDIIGKAFVRLFPVTQAAVHPGAVLLPR